MRTAVVISTLGRPETLQETVESVQRQSVLPVAILLSVCTAADVSRKTLELPLARVVFGPKGLTKQRNTSLAALPGEAEFVLFLDDDVELARDYIARMEAMFAAHPEIVVASGGVCSADGPRLGRAVGREEAADAVHHHRCEDRMIKSEGAYGCNMFVRRSVLGIERFDEQLLLESWLEDYDFSVRCSRHGEVVWNLATCVAHLGVQRGSKERGFRVGYAQIANSHYLWRKGVIPSLGKLLWRFWLPALRVSLQGTIRPKPPWSERFDYPGRLRGNVRALLDAASFRLKPERILEFDEYTGAEAASRG
jgi:glycosyltransferase involved in cell wall biosynthesis